MQYAQCASCEQMHFITREYSCKHNTQVSRITIMQRGYQVCVSGDFYVRHPVRVGASPETWINPNILPHGQK